MTTLTFSKGVAKKARKTSPVSAQRRGLTVVFLGGEKFFGKSGGFHVFQACFKREEKKRLLVFPLVNYGVIVVFCNINEHRIISLSKKTKLIAWPSAHPKNNTYYRLPTLHPSVPSTFRTTGHLRVGRPSAYHADEVDEPLRKSSAPRVSSSPSGRFFRPKI